MYCAYCFAIKKDLGSQRCHRCGEVYKRNSPLYLQPEGKLNKQYLIGRVLGHGGFGVTYLGYDIQLRTRVAIKEYYPKEWAYRDVESGLLYPHAGDSSQLFDIGKQRFIQEARLLTNFRNENIIRVINSFEAMGTAYYIMEYLDGQTLNQFLDEQARELGQNSHKLSFQETLKVIVPLMKGLQDVHQLGYIHRDIKPDNIYLSDQGFPVLLDFGSARSQRFVVSSSLDEVVTPGYSPYEQYYSQGNQGPWSDVYAMAATAYRLLTGQRPPDAPDMATKTKPLIPPRQRGANLSQEEESWLLKGLEIKPEDRPQSFRAWLQSLPGRQDSDSGGTDEASFIRMVILPKLNDKVLTYAEEEEIYRSAMQHTTIGPERARFLIEQSLIDTGSKRDRPNPSVYETDKQHYIGIKPDKRTMGLGELFRQIGKTEGRVGRLEYFCTTNLIFAVVTLPSIALAFIAPSIALIVYFGGTLIASIPSIRQMVKRFHDLDKTGYCIFLLLIPLYNLLIAARLYFVKGTEGSNRYGEDPLRSQITGFATVVCILLMLINFGVGMLVQTSSALISAGHSLSTSQGTSDSEKDKSESMASSETSPYDTSSDTATSEDNQTFVRELKTNMHTLQTMVETYAVDWGGCYPKNLTALKLEAQKPDLNYWKEIVNPLTGKSGLGESMVDSTPSIDYTIKNYNGVVTYTTSKEPTG